MDLHPGETVIFEGHPSWRSTLGFYLKGLGISLLIGAVGWFALSHAGGAGIAAGAFAIVVVLGLVKRMATTYVISNQRLHIRRGIVSRHTQESRLDRVQNVNTNQSILQRLLRVGTVDFDTAGTEDSDFSFVGVASPADVVTDVNRAQREAATTPAE
jgi:uncharacterized membrane protein YdbT with pleckstrin-like domain